MAITYTPISTYTVPSGNVSTVTFNNIPQTYTDLYVLISARASVTSAYYGTGQFRLNDTAGTGYFNRRVLAAAGTIYNNADSGYNIGIWGSINGNTTTAGTFSNTELFIPGYTTSNTKIVMSNSCLENYSTSNYEVSQWSNVVGGVTSAVTKITFIDATGGYGNHLENSIFTLYGVKNA